jgi:hypothetical protein
VLADIDGNGKTDIVTGEMTAGGWSFPQNPRPRVLAYLGKADRSFERRELAFGLGVHEMGLVPPKNDGRISIFAADEIQPQKFPDMQTQVNLWTIERPGN